MIKRKRTDYSVLLDFSLGEIYDLSADYLCEIEACVKVSVAFLVPFLHVAGGEGVEHIGKAIQPPGEVFEDLFEHVLLFPFCLLLVRFREPS
jgi:hypothetical protein